MNKQSRSISAVFGKATAKLKGDFQEGYIHARRKFENSIGFPLMVGTGFGGMVGCLKLVLSDDAKAGLITYAFPHALMAGGAGIIGGHLMMKGIAEAHAWAADDHLTQPEELLSWVRPSVLTGIGVMAVQAFNNATQSNASLLTAGLVVGAAAFAPTITQIAGMATRAADVVTKHPRRDFR